VTAAIARSISRGRLPEPSSVWAPSEPARPRADTHQPTL